jgi:hypothetical protein
MEAECSLRCSQETATGLCPVDIPVSRPTAKKAADLYFKYQNIASDTNAVTFWTYNLLR